MFYSVDNIGFYAKTSWEAMQKARELKLKGKLIGHFKNGDFAICNIS